MIMRLYLLSQIIILVLDSWFGCAFAVALIDKIDALHHLSLLLLKLSSVVVADNINDIALLDSSLKRNQMEESFISIGVLWSLIDWEKAV